jgi:hypothetical protein
MLTYFSSYRLYKGRLEYGIRIGKKVAAAYTWTYSACGYASWLYMLDANRRQFVYIYFF